jgi:hypothetical protein
MFDAVGLEQGSGAIKRNPFQIAAEIQRHCPVAAGDALALQFQVGYRRLLCQ